MAEYKKESVNDIFSKINGLNDMSDASKKDDEVLLSKRIRKMTLTSSGFEEMKNSRTFNKISEMKYSYNDIMVKPAVISTIEHRAECNPYDEDGNLPLFTAPMDTVVNIDNFNLFQEHGIIPILPRTCKEEDRVEFSRCGKWAAFSLQEFEKWFLGKCTPKNEKTPLRALIDIANGHISKLYELVRASKRVYGDSIKIMVGNIANPDTYRICVESRVDYVRCSIGTGCFTEDAIIKTDNGNKKISEVKVGDKVLTHRNKYEEVVDTISYKNTNRLIKVNGVKCTGNHKFYVINKEDVEKAKNNVECYAFWVEAEKLDKNKHLLIKLV